MIDRKNIVFIILEHEMSHAEAIRRSLSVSVSECEIYIASSLQEFNYYASNIVPNLVIADMNLPDGNALSILNGDPENQLWPVLVLTSHGDEEMAVKAIKSGALDYIVKTPEALKNLQHVVSRILRDWRNIQKRRLAETALRENERKFRALFETMNQGVIYYNHDGNIVSANPSAEKLLGFSMDQIEPKETGTTLFQFIHEDGSDFPEDMYPALVALRSGVPVKDVVMGIYHHSYKQYKWLLVSAVPQFRDSEPEPYQVFSTFIDITAQKKTEQILQQQNIELKKAKEKAEESDRLKTAFMANMSHEIRTPMNGILGFADLLKSSDLSGESQKKYIDVIESSGKRMLNIINDLIDISNIEAGLIEIKREIVDIGKLFDDLIIRFISDSNSKNLILKCCNDLPWDKLFIETDKVKLSQVMVNLIKNSIKFTNKGSIEFGCRFLDSTYLFYVKDTGIGIRKEYHKKIFERFQQGEIPAADIHEGVGLGLAISKAYVELLGGSISVESDLGKGSLFYFTIPYSDPFKQPVVPETDISNAESLPLKVLIAEDEEIIYMFLNEVLKKNSIKTYYAKDGLEAVDAVKKYPDINLVLMDVKMPRMDGIEATRQIKQLRPEIPIIAQSAFVTDADIQSALQAGCSDYITKPIEKTLLLKKISLYRMH